MPSSFDGLTTPHLADACVRIGVPVRCAPTELVALVPGTRVFGRVAPLRSRPCHRLRLVVLPTLYVLLLLLLLGPASSITPLFAEGASRERCLEAVVKLRRPRHRHPLCQRPLRRTRLLRHGRHQRRQTFGLRRAVRVARRVDRRRKGRLLTDGNRDRFR